MLNKEEYRVVLTHSLKKKKKRVVLTHGSIKHSHDHANVHRGAKSCTLVLSHDNNHCLHSS